MSTQWTRRQVLARVGIAAAAIHTLDPHELCCVLPADAKTADKDLFELKRVADGVYAAIAALGLGLAAVQLLPTAELQREGIRGGGLASPRPTIV